MDFYKLQKEAIEAYVHCFDFFFEQVRKRECRSIYIGDA